MAEGLHCPMTRRNSPPWQLSKNTAGTVLLPLLLLSCQPLSPPSPLGGGDGVPPTTYPQLQERPARIIPALSMPRVSTGGSASTTAEDAPPLLELTLSEGVPAGLDAPVVGEVSALPEARVRELLGRLPGWADDPDYMEPLSEGERPRTDAIRSIAEREPSFSSSLQVLSVTPSGKTEFVPYVTVVFSEPMVALGMDGEPLAGTPPVQMDPETPGSWRWLDQIFCI